MHNQYQSNYNRQVPKKGFAHIIPILVITLLISTGFIGLSQKSDNSQKLAVGKVLSEKSEAEKQAEEQAKESSQKENESQGESIKKATEQQKKNSNDTSFPSTSNNSQNKTKVEIEKEKNKLKIKTKNKETGFESETETEGGKEKTKIKFGDIKIEYEREGDKIVTKFKDENGQELELEASEESEILDEAENEIEDDDIKIATGSSQTGFVQKGRRVRTNFPLSINPSTGELFVTTPSGIKVVTILPQEAIENMIKAGVLTRLEEPPIPTPPESISSSSAVSVEGAPIEITEVNNTPTYVISGIKTQKMLGFIPVDIKIKTYVSATDGSLIKIQESLLSRILDLISF